MNTNSPSREEGWKKELLSFWSNKEVEGRARRPSYEKIALFIERTLSSQRDTLMESCEQIKRECKAAKPTDHIEEVDERAFCAGVDAAIKLIKESI